MNARPTATVWLERGFSRRPIAERMKRAVPGLRLIGTPKLALPGATALALPDFGKPGAVDHANRLIAEYGIDALWVQNSARFPSLSQLDCTVHAAATPDVIKLVDDKSAFSDWLGDDPVRADAVEVTGIEALSEEYYRRRAEGRQVCVKPVIGVNGFGYWHLTEDEGSSLLFSDPNRRRIHPSVYFVALGLEEDRRGPQRLLVMDWLPGPEVSFDLLCWRGRPLIHAARTKVEEDIQIVSAEHPMTEHAYRTAERLALHGIVSMQYRLDSDRDDRMLEINPRPAGGCIHSEDAGFGVIGGFAKLVAGIAGPDDMVQYRGPRKRLEFDRVPRITTMDD